MRATAVGALLATSGARPLVAMGFLGCLNESSKERELLGSAGNHPLGMPVDGEEKAPRAFNPLDNPVRSSGVDREIRRQVANDLVVGAGHVQLSNAENLDEARAFHNRHRVRSEEHTSELQSPLNLVCRLL